MSNGDFFDLIVALALFCIVHIFVSRSALKNNDKESWIVECATVALGFAGFILMLICYGYFYDGNFVIWGNNKQSTAVLVTLIVHTIITLVTIYKFSKNKKEKNITEVVNEENEEEPLD